MDLKSIFLGSTISASLITGAKSADVIVFEPEPVNFVRICDAYGQGFFYIPGTETCMQFNGFVRSSYEKVHIDGAYDTDTANAGGVIDDVSATFWGQRARLNIDTRNETDLGTLRAQLRLEAGDSNTDADYDMDRALISIAGFRFGFTDNYWTSNHNYTGTDFAGIGGNLSGGLLDEGWYGFDDATMFDYTFASNGLAITAGVEDPRISVGQGGGGNATNSGGTDGRANFYAGINYSDGWGTLAFTAVHDSLAPDNSGADAVSGAGGADFGGWAYKASADLKLDEWLSGGSLHFMYMWDGEYNTDYLHNYSVLNDIQSAYQIAGQFKLNEQLQLMAQYSHAKGDDGGTLNGVAGGEGDAWIGSVGLNWFPVELFTVSASYFFGEVDNTAGDGTSAADLPRTSYDFEGFFVGVRRDF